MPTHYRDDPEWAAAHDDYVKHDPDVTPEEEYARRVVAATKMWQIECQHAGKPCPVLPARVQELLMKDAS